MAVCPEAAHPDRSVTEDLSDETFKSFADEVQSCCSSSSSGGRQPWPHASGSNPDSGKQTTSLEQGDGQYEPSDLEDNETKLSKKWISYPKGKETNSGKHSPDTKLKTEIARVSDEELNALQSFCSIKINLIHHGVDSKEKKSSGRKKLQFRWDAEASETDALNCTVPDELLNRMYFKNIRTRAKQVAAAKQHISSQCPSCNRKRAELAQCAFLKQKKILLESHLLEKKIDEHLHTKDFLTRVGEAHQDLPRLSDDPRIIWERLNEKSQIGYSGCERSGIEQKL
ncbi:uncharacterized protein C8orf48 homolog [Cynocephalus volans]|uniref:uncharacterized protein C8orf48 homolog n=1 Tax=Cynocephalus volans TaxID=110931 RepID=UPI002FC8B955